MSGDAIARVVPDLATFSVDEGFEYLVGDHDVRVGSLVRVPLSGRPRRGYVVDLRHGVSDNLKSIRSVSGARAVFDSRLLRTVDDVAAYYVAPRSVVLGKVAPPNLPKSPKPLELPSIPPCDSAAPEATRDAAQGRGGGHVQVLAGSEWGTAIRGLVTGILVAGRSAVVVLPTAAEAGRLAGLLRRDLGARVLEAEGDDASVTMAWSRAAANPGVVLLGTPKVVWWPVEALAAIVLVDEGRRGMKERQTPTVSAARVAATRAAHEDLTVFHLGRVPTAETFGRNPRRVRVGGRLWPPVEVVDRREEAPGSGLFTERVRAAVRQTIRGSGRAFFFTHQRGYAPASRCASCRELRLCQQCGARPDPGPECRRCGAGLDACAHCGGRRFEALGAGAERVVEEARRAFGDATVGMVDATQPAISVGTERDLVHLGPVDLAIAVDADGLIRGTNYRAGEDALAVLARVAARVREGRTNRLIVQTVSPDHPVLEALRRADPLPFFERELAERRSLGMPPIGEVLVLEVSELEGVDEEIRLATAGAVVFGPSSRDGVGRWLIQGRDLTEVKRDLRPLVGKLRDRGGRVRVDADPRDL
ncbi:MAG: hypothetical protein OEM97_10500 [Acidimicrobiia bacterium]|nr:hypothetical protein [Acidimicrobiia bacterium]